MDESQTLHRRHRLAQNLVLSKFRAEVVEFGLVQFSVGMIVR